MSDRTAEAAQHNAAPPEPDWSWFDKIRLLPVTERVCFAKAEVQAVAKEGKTAKQMGEYKYASVDDVYHAIRPILSRWLLDLQIDVVGVDRFKAARPDGGETVWLTFSAMIGFEGEKPRPRHLMLPLTGPQSFEAAYSYFSKQYLRQRLQLETGDYDVDDLPPEQRTGRAPQPAPRQRAQRQERQPRERRERRQPPSERDQLVARFKKAIKEGEYSDELQRELRRSASAIPREEVPALRKLVEELEAEVAARRQPKPAPTPPKPEPAPAEPEQDADAEAQEIQHRFDELMARDGWDEEQIAAAYDELQSCQNIEQARMSLLRWDKLYAELQQGEAADEFEHDEPEGPPVNLDSPIDAVGVKLEDGSWGAEIEVKKGQRIMPGQKMMVSSRNGKTRFPAFVAEVVAEEDDDQGRHFVIVSRSKPGK